MFKRLFALGLAALLACACANQTGQAPSVVSTLQSPALGKPMVGQQAPAWTAYTVFPDGQGLPTGAGTATQGKALYASQCVQCHGVAGKGGVAGAVVGPVLPRSEWIKSARPAHTTGQYWPYATTVFDYIRRAMPANAPGTLSNDEVYAITAYLLAEQGIISPAEEMNQNSLPAVRMPNRDGFVRNPKVPKDKP